MGQFRILLYAGLLGFTLMAFKSSTSGSDPYKKMAKDLCDCFNDATSGLSRKGRKIIEDAGLNPEDVMKALGQYVEEYPVKAAKDVEILTSLDNDQINTCVSAIDSKYSDVNAELSADEVQNRIIAKMSSIKSCKLTNTFLIIGVNQDK